MLFRWQKAKGRTDQQIEKERIELPALEEGYRRLTFMMLDADIAAVSPSSVWRGLGQAGSRRSRINMGISR